MLADHDAARIESRLEHVQRLARFSIAAHEDVERRIAAFRPCVNADMALGENGNAGDATTFRERMQMNVQERRSGGIHRIDQRLFDMIAVAESSASHKSMIR